MGRNPLRLIFAALLVAACAPKPEGPAYKLGYADGCSSGYSLAGKSGDEPRYVRNETMFNDDSDYRTGWSAGQRACFGPARDKSIGVGVGVGGGRGGVGGGLGVFF